jgi:preprotein translocase subunit SecF
VTMGVYSIVGFEVTPATAIGLLTILGFSLYDTVVVFDKVKENTRGLLGLTRRTYAEAANLALNQTLMRSINTSLIAVLPVLGLMVVGVGLLGVGTLADLALVQIVGILAGAASSLLLATPILVDLKQRDPRVREQARRVATRRARVAAAAGSSGSGSSGSGSSVAGSSGAGSSGTEPSDDDLDAMDGAGEQRRERALAAAAGVPARSAHARRPAGSSRARASGTGRPTGKRRR